MFWRLRVLAFYTIISLIIVSFFILFYLPIKLIPVSYNFRYRIATILSYIFIYSMWVICGIKFSVTGLEKLPRDKKPYLALANHQSFWENFFMQLIIPIHSWVIKEELFDIPVFGPCLKLLDPIAVDRNNNRSVVQILEEGKKKINENLSIVMFPEATRIKVTSTIKFKPSCAKLALETGGGIVLIAHNAGLIWPKGFWFKKSGTIKVTIIEYMSPQIIKQIGDVRALTSYIQERINTEKNLLAK